MKSAFPKFTKILKRYMPKGAFLGFMRSMQYTKKAGSLNTVKLATPDMYDQVYFRYSDLQNLNKQSLFSRGSLQISSLIVFHYLPFSL